MQYKFTSQYSKGEELIIAEFMSSLDVNLFLEKKVQNDIQQDRKLIYRIYHIDELIRLHQPADLCVSYAQYAEGNGDMTREAFCHYHVILTSRYSLKNKMLGCFKNIGDARLYILAKSEEDDSICMEDYFMICQHQLLLETITKTMLLNQKFISSEQKNHLYPNGFHPRSLALKMTPPGFQEASWSENSTDSTDE